MLLPNKPISSVGECGGRDHGSTQFVAAPVGTPEASHYQAAWQSKPEGLPATSGRDGHGWPTQGMAACKPQASDALAGRTLMGFLLVLMMGNRTPHKSHIRGCWLFRTASSFGGAMYPCFCNKSMHTCFCYFLNFCYHLIFSRLEPMLKTPKSL